MQRKIFSPIFLFVFPFILTAQSTAKEWYRKGIELKNKQDHSGALAAFKNAISKKPDYNNAYYEGGLCCNEVENFEDGVDFFNKYSPVSNTDKKNRCNELGYSYYRLRNAKNAIEYCSAKK